MAFKFFYGGWGFAKNDRMLFSNNTVALVKNADKFVGGRDETFALFSADVMYHLEIKRNYFISPF